MKKEDADFDLGSFLAVVVFPIAFIFFGFSENGRPGIGVLVVSLYLCFVFKGFNKSE